MRTTLMCLCVAVLLTMAAGSVGAQEKPTAPTAPAAAAPAYTETQQLKLQNLVLQQQLAQTQLTLLQTALKQVEAERETLLVAIEKDHPGFIINRETLRFEPKPAPAKK